MSQQIETEGYEPLPKGVCPECGKEMVVLKDKFKCFKCGIEVENGKK